MKELKNNNFKNKLPIHVSVRNMWAELSDFFLISSEFLLKPEMPNSTRTPYCLYAT